MNHLPPDPPSEPLTIVRLRTDAQARVCARMRANSEPWITLGRSYDDSLRAVQDPSRETYVARRGRDLAGFVILCMSGAFVGYIQSICVDPKERGRGIGEKLMRFAEDRIFRDVPNVFLCVSSFNNRAKDWYRRLGYEEVGELKDYIVRGHSEILMRKTRGPLGEWKRPANWLGLTFFC